LFSVPLKIYKEIFKYCQTLDDSVVCQQYKKTKALKQHCVTKAVEY